MFDDCGERMKLADREEAMPYMLQSIFLLTPVISTTFASAQTFLGDVKKSGVLGTLIVDEAGQAQPQMAVGAMFRCRKAIIVGDPKDVILELRTKRGLSQDDLVEKVMVTRQAVSRWENGETVPNTDTLKLLSKEFDVSINTLLGEPRKLICQCCGMPLEDAAVMGRDSDGALNEDYCKWCYADGTYTYSNMDDLIDVCVKNMVGENFTEEQARAYLKEILPKLDYWKRYEQLSDGGQFEAFKEQLIDEINALHIEGMPRLERLNALVGKYVNLEYRLPNGMNVRFLDDEKTYLGNQLECEFGGDRYFGVLADMDFILISTYEAEGTNPELVLYKKR